MNFLFNEHSINNYSSLIYKENDTNIILINIL